MGEEYRATVVSESSSVEYLARVPFGQGTAKGWTDGGNMGTTGQVDFVQTAGNVRNQLFSGRVRLNATVSGQTHNLRQDSGGFVSPGSQVRLFNRFQQPSALAGFQQLRWSVYAYDGVNLNQFSIQWNVVSGAWEVLDAAGAFVAASFDTVIDDLFADAPIWQEIEIDVTIQGAGTPTYDRVRYNQGVVSTGIGNARRALSGNAPRVYPQLDWWVVAPGERNQYEDELSLRLI